MNIVATTYSALAAGLLRHQSAAEQFVRSTLPSSSNTAATAAPEAQSPSTPAATTYDSRGRVLQEEDSSEDMVAAAAELLSSKEQVEVSAATLRKALEMQGSLLDVLA